ncbi:hypothetical protein Bhyg_10693 [Pseudolycoriella hygida]|uniref:Uncharacterized protein n=1 Tax=Pseudolycoriella hygida TaxID=35572 RepID=A0A9Q0MWL2_9DIPT|nr:hypothetical protein Bhyg_10693 [Pseudolycoriella hygida]
MLSNHENVNECNKWSFICEFKKLKEHYENLIDSISQELEFYKREHTILRTEIRNVTSLNNSHECGEDFTKYQKLSEAVVKNLNQQIEKLTQVVPYPGRTLLENYEQWYQLWMLE